MNKEKKKMMVPKLRFPEFREEPEWEEKQLKDVCQMQAGKFVNASEIYENWSKGLFPCYGGNGLRGYTKSYTHNGKYSLIGRQGALCGNITLTAGCFHATEHALVTSPKDGVNTDWLYFKLLFLRLNQYATGQAQPGLSVENLEKIDITVPKKEKEQQKIASFLTSLDSLITAQTQKIQALQAHKKGLMQQLFPAEGEMVPMVRFGEFERAGEWEIGTLGEICKINSGGTPNRAEKDYWDGGNIPWITTSLINFNIIYQANEFITKNGLQNSSAKIFPKNTILMAMYGQGKTRGKVAILGIESATNQACAAIILKDGFDPNFVFQYLAGRYDEIRELSNSGGQENLSAGLIESIPFANPVIAEQQKIADCLSSLDDLITAQKQKLEALKMQKKGLMQQLFPNPNEKEP